MPDPIIPVRHPSCVGPIDCKEPKRGLWGGPWSDLRVESNKPASAEKLAFVPRGGVTLTSFVRTDVPELGVTAGKGPLPVIAAVNSASPAATGADAPAPAASAGAPGSAGGCGSCSSTGSPTTELGFFLALAVLARRRRAP